MAQYIDKSALVAEIEKLLDKGKYHEEYDCGYRDGNNNALYALKVKIDTLEVKEVDLEKELDVIIDSLNDDKCEHLSIHQQLSHIARHFFELGLKTKGE